MMFNTPYSMSNVVAFFWIHVHWVFVGLTIFGFIAGLIWLSKHASKKEFWKTVKWTLIIGIIGVLITAPLGLRGWALTVSPLQSNYGHLGMNKHMLEDCEENGIECSFNQMLERMMQSLERTGVNK